MQAPIQSLQRHRGFSLPELMISMAIGLIILAGMATLFVNNSRAADEVEKANRQIETGRFALQTLAIDARNAGYYAEFDPSKMPLPAAMPAPCSTTITAISEALPLVVQGYDNYTASMASTLTCLSDVKLGTDVLLVRRVQTCTLGEGNCEAASAGGVLFQASMCNNSLELLSGDVEDHFDIGTATADLTRHKRDCNVGGTTGTLAPAHRFVTHIYFVANNDQSGDGIPTLKRAELGGTTLGWTIVPLADGVENLQIDYGIDVDTDTDASAETFSSSPGTLADWRNVVSIRIALLARNINPTPTFTDTKSYKLGRTATVAAANDHYKRHVFESLVSLPNPTGRKTPQ